MHISHEDDSSHVLFNNTSTPSSQNNINDNLPAMTKSKQIIIHTYLAGDWGTKPSDEPARHKKATAVENFILNCRISMSVQAAGDRGWPNVDQDSLRLWLWKREMIEKVMDVTYFNYFEGGRLQTTKRFWMIGKALSQFRDLCFGFEGIKESVLCQIFWFEAPNVFSTGLSQLEPLAVAEFRSSRSLFVASAWRAN